MESYTPPMKNSLEGWSHSQRSGIWWSRSYEKIGSSEITGCHLDNLVSLTDHCDFNLCLWGQCNEPSYQWDPTWALSLTCLLRNRYAGQEATVRTGYGTMDWFQIGKGVCQGCILSPCLFNLYAKYIMWNARLDQSTSWNQDCWEKY